MKNAFFLLIVIIALAACRKEDSATPSTDLPDNSWTWNYSSTIWHASYSDINTRKGYLLIFHPEPATGLNQSISFLFRARPQTGTSFKPSKDTSAANAVKITLTTSNLPTYTSFSSGDAQVQATITDGKLNIIGNSIRMLRDTTSAIADTTTLSFNLTEF